MNVYEVIRRPIVTEKGVTKKDEAERRCASKWLPDANKTQIKAGRREGVQSEGGGRADGEHIDGKAAPPRTFLRVPVGLEEGLRQA